jgi:type VI secretion system secreted protein VgrG
MIRLLNAALGERAVLRLRGREGMDELSSWQVDVEVGGAADTESLLASLPRSRATLIFSDQVESHVRGVALMVTEVTVQLLDRRGIGLRLQLSDRAWTLTRGRNHRMFVDKSTTEIVAAVLREAGLGDVALDVRLRGDYGVRPQCVQYAESDWAFVTRLLAEEGISYWFETLDDASTRLCLADARAAHAGIEGGTSMVFASTTGDDLQCTRPLFDLSWEESIVTDQVMVRDFDVRHPGRYFDGHAGEGDFFYFEYPAGVETQVTAKQRAEARLSQLQRDRIVVEGRSRSLRLAPGRKLDLHGAEPPMFDQRYLVRAIEHIASSKGERGGGLSYECRVTLSPELDCESQSVRRPAPEMVPATPRAALETAITTGAPGEEIHVDDLGRVKIRFLWDRSGIVDDNSSAWVRALQYPMGGSMFLPRVGWEVLVAYLDGRIDRPFVLGRLYNGSATTPYSLPAAAAVSSFQSHTSPRNGATQEIKMGDTKGGQQFFVHATRDLSMRVGGTQTTKIAGNETHSVGLSLSSTILGAHASTIGSNQNIDVGKELVIGIDGSSTESIGAAETINVSANRSVMTGTYNETIGGAYGIQCNQSNTRVSGPFSRVVTANKVIGAGLGVTESVAGGRAYVCLGSRAITTAKSYDETVYGVRRSSAGSVVEEALGNIGVSASAASLTAGTAAIKAGGNVSIKATTISLQCSGTIHASSALSLGGGALKTKSGTCDVTGNTTRSSGGEVG